MNVNELRMGNYVFFDGDEKLHLSVIDTIYNNNVEVEIIDEGEEFLSFNQVEAIKRIKPIPITKKTLLDMGFKHDKRNRCFIKLDKINFMTFNYTNGNVVIIEMSGKNVVSLAIIKHIHELQNLYFAITRNELKFTSSSENEL